MCRGGVRVEVGGSEGRGVKEVGGGGRGEGRGSDNKS